LTCSTSRVLSRNIAILSAIVGDEYGV